MDREKLQKIHIKKKRILITGGAGLLGSSLASYLKKNYTVFLGLNNQNIFLKDVKKKFLKYNQPKLLEKQILKINPHIIINCIGLSSVENCEKNKSLAVKSNIKIPVILSKVSNKYKIRYYHISTDHLYNGFKRIYNERNKVSPLNFYAKTKHFAEKKILKSNKNAFIIRTNFFCFGKGRNKSFSDKIIETIKKGKKIELFYDVKYTPISVKYLSYIIEKSFKKKISGIFNISSENTISKYSFGISIAETFNLDKNLIIPINIRDKNLTARPLNMSLDGKLISKKLNVNQINTNKMIGELKNDFENKNNLIPYGKHTINNEDINEVVRTLRSGHLTQGPKINELEDKIKNYVGCKYAVAVSSCTAGMHIALKALDLKKKKVILPPITFVSTANTILMNNLVPKFIDIDPKTANIDISRILKEVKSKNDIGAIMPVHFAGNPCDLKKIQILRKNGIKIVEDSAHALGSTYKCGSRIGSCKYSDISIFSLHPVKTIAAGEGGIVTTNDFNLYKSLLRLRSHGINKSDDKFLVKKNAYTNKKINPWYYEMQQLGYHYRLTDIQSTLAVSQLKRINLFLKKRKEITKAYNKAFRAIKYIKILNEDLNHLSSNHLYILRIDFKNLKISRQKLMTQLKRKGIITQVHYIPVTLHPYYLKKGYSIKNTPNASLYYNEALSIPIYYDLTIEQQKYIINSLKKLLKI